MHRLNTYLDDLSQDDIEYISIKISTIYSQINLLAWDKTLEILSERLRQLVSRRDEPYLYARRRF